jgi:uncharacterized protein YrzB (UPF0473 family)
MIHGDNSLCEFNLEGIWVFSGFETLFYLSHFFKGHIGREFIVVEDEIIADVNKLLIHIERGIIDEDTVWLTLTHLLTISSDKEFGCEDILFRKSERMEESSSSEEIEVLIIAPELDITRSILASDRDTIISLHDRIEEFLERDAFSCLISLGEIISIEHLCHREVLRKFTDSCEVHLIESFAIVIDFEF